MPLLAGRFGHPYLYREVCESTQELVRGLPEGAVAATDNQTAGRGRRGRHWVSAPGDGRAVLAVAVAATPAERLAPFSLVLAEAVCEALDERAMVRWPNDVVVDGRKLAGVLPELRDGQLIAGIGINADADGRAAAATAHACRRPRCGCCAAAGRPGARCWPAVLLAIERRYDRLRARRVHRARARRAGRAHGAAGRRRRGRRRRHRRRRPAGGGGRRPRLGRGRARRGQPVTIDDVSSTDIGFAARVAGAHLDRARCRDRADRTAPSSPARTACTVRRRPAGTCRARPLAGAEVPQLHRHGLATGGRDDARPAPSSHGRTAPPSPAAALTVVKLEATRTLSSTACRLPTSPEITVPPTDDGCAARLQSRIVPSGRLVGDAPGAVNVQWYAPPGSTGALPFHVCSGPTRRRCG